MKKLIFTVIIIASFLTVYVNADTGYGISATFYLDTAENGQQITPPSENVNKKPIIMLVRGSNNPLKLQNITADEYWNFFYTQYNNSSNKWAVLDVVPNSIYDGNISVALGGNQLKERIEDLAENGTRDIYLVTHSIGGLVAREALWLLGEKKNYVKKVITLGTPHTGIDLPNLWCLDTLGYNTLDSTPLSTNYFKWLWNDSNSKYVTFAGNSSIWGDGVVSLDSAYGIDEIGITLPYSDRFTIDRNHYQLPKLYNQIIFWLKNEAAQNYAINLLQNEKQTQIYNGSVLCDTIPLNQTKVFVFSADNADKMTVNVNTAGKHLMLALKNGSNNVLAPIVAEDSSEGSLITSLILNNPNKDNYTLYVTNPLTNSADLIVKIGTMFEGGLELVSQTNSFYNTNFGPAKLQFKVNNPSAYSGNLLMYADIDGDLYDLYDDATNGDAIADDNIFTAQLNELDNRYVLAKVHLADSSNQNYPLRSQIVEFSVSDELIKAVPDANYYNENLDSNPKYDYLIVPVKLAIEKESDYNLYGELSDADGNIISTASIVVPSASIIFSDSPISEQTVELAFSGNDIQRANLTNAVLTLSNLNITDIGTEKAYKVFAMPNDFYQSDEYNIANVSSSDYQDTNPPDYINDLAASPFPSGIHLSWTAPDNNGKAAKSYDIRYSTNGISYSSWLTEAKLSASPVPAIPGTTQNVVIPNLKANTYYWVAIRSYDENNNLSEISNKAVSWTNINEAPIAESITPNNGTAYVGIQKTFTSTYTDPNGVSDFQYVKLLVNDKCNANGAAYFVYKPGENKFYIRNNVDANVGVGVIPGTATNLVSDNAILDCKSSTIVKYGNSIIVTWKVTFKAPLAEKTCFEYISAADNQNLIAPWVNKGSIKIINNFTPVNGTVTPNTGKAFVGFQKTFTSTYIDENGNADIQYVKLLINDKLSANGAAYFAYKPAENKFYIRDNADANIGVGIAPGTAANLESLNAILDCKNSTVIKAGNTLTVIWKVIFKNTMANKNCIEYLTVADNQNAVAAWANKGTVKIENNSTPTLGTVSPNTGSFVINTVQTFTSTYSDVNGANDLQYVKLLINDKLNTNGAATLVYKANENKFYIKNNADSYFSVGVTPGIQTDLGSENAILHCGSSSAIKNANILTVTWKVTFKNTLAGKTCFEYLTAADMQNTVAAWDNKGSIKITQ